MIKDTRPIGMYDSGVGGLTVVRAVQDLLPHEDVIYLADTARVPYGDKSRDDIVQFSRQIMDFLTGRGCKMLVVACNTSSAIALPDMAQRLDVPIVGMIVPGAAKAVRTTRNGRIGIMATNNTAKSGAYGRAIRNLLPEAEVYEVGCPLLVPMVESGQLEGERVREAIRGYIGDMLERGIDTLIYGCTHYPYLREERGKVAGETVRLVDPAIEVADEVRKITEFDFNGRVADGGKPQGSLEVLVTGDTEAFKSSGLRLLGRGLDDVKHLDLEDLISE